MIVGVKILPREEVLDSQGRAVENTLQQHNYTINGCRVGKYIQLNVEASTEDEALKKAKEITEFVLINPLVETFQLEIV